MLIKVSFIASFVERNVNNATYWMVEHPYIRLDEYLLHGSYL